MKYSAITLTLLTLSGAASASVAVYDFNSGSAFSTDFHTNYTGTQISQQSGGGLGGSGSLDTNSADGTQVWFSQANFGTLDIGDTLSLSLCFQHYAGSTVGGIKLGLTTDSTAGATGVGMPTSGSYVYFGWWKYSGQSAESEVIGGGGASIYNGGGSGQLVGGGWYKQLFSFTKTATNQFDVNWGLYEAGPSGDTGASVFEGSKSVTSSALNNPLYAYIGFENPLSSGMYSAVDNITMNSDAIINNSSVSVVPEPASALLGGLGLLGLLRRRRG